jgi:hypothetical protein
MQRLHPDAQTDPAGVEYFVLGNGHLIAAIQHATGAALAMGQTPLGLMLWDPHHFARKWSTYTFHPEWGLRRGMVTVRAGDETFAVDPATLTVRRVYPDGVPVVEAQWPAGPYRVTERYWMAADAPLLLRDVTLHNPTAQAVPVAFTTTLYANHVLFSAHHTDHDAGALRADGYAHLELFADPVPTLNTRYLTVDAGTAPPRGTAAARLHYAANTRKERVTSVSVPTRWERASAYWDQFAAVQTPEPDLDHLYRAARDNLRAAISDEGRFDASMWQYNMEWLVDASGVLLAATRTGQFNLAGTLLDHLCTHLVDDEGYTMHASRFRPGPGTELNQNGALLGAAWTYWAWTGDLDRIERHWPTLQRVAELPLRPDYLHESGLVKASIELFERDASAGVLPGFDVAHQATVAWGLEKAADLARRVGDGDSAERWQAAGARMRETMLHDPTYALVEDGRLIKRRLPDGRRQATLVPEAVGSDLIPADSELARAGTARLDPDVGALWPMLFGQVDPQSDLAQTTIADVKALWNDATGGYLRYHPSGDPDAPGGWTFPTAIVGQVLARAGDGEGVRRVLDWFTSVQGARGGAYFEIYSDASRPVPPLPPMGIIVWGWAEIASLFVSGLLGATPTPSGTTLRLDPHLPAGLDSLEATLRYRSHQIDVQVMRVATPQPATFDGDDLPYDATRGVVLPDPLRSGTVVLPLATP